MLVLDDVTLGKGTGGEGEGTAAVHFLLHFTLDSLKSNKPHILIVDLQTGKPHLTFKTVKVP